MASLKRALMKGIHGASEKHLTQGKRVYIAFKNGFIDDDMVVVNADSNNIVVSVKFSHPFSEETDREHDDPIEEEDIIVLINIVRAEYGFDLTV